MTPTEFKFELVKLLKVINEDRNLSLVESTSMQKLHKYVSKRNIKEMARQIVNSGPDLDVSEFLYTNVPDFHASKKENFFRKLTETHDGGEIDGVLVDNFSAFMVSRVLDKLTYEEKVRLLNKPISEILSISYKLSSRSEF